MPLAGHSEILPLHGKPEGSLAHWAANTRAYARNIARRISLSRGLVAVVVILVFYVFTSFHRNPRSPGRDLVDLDLHPKIPLKDKKARADHERMMLEWDARSNYRTDLSETGPGRISSFHASLFSPSSSSSNSAAEPGAATAASSKYIPVTAVILSWKRKEGAKAVVAHLRKYPFIQEILIWNNNPEIELLKTEFADRGHRYNNITADHSPSVTVFNSVANLHDFSKYTTCSLAKYDHCYIQDDDWINLAMDSMYALVVDQPDSLVTSTIPAMHAQQRSWTFQNAQIGLHTGFSWLGAGSFMPKSAVFKFLQQLGGSNLWKERVQLSDLFFSIWRNQYPIVLSHALAPLDQSSSWSGRIDQWSVVYEHMVIIPSLSAFYFFRFCSLSPHNVRNHCS